MPINVRVTIGKEESGILADQLSQELSVEVDRNHIGGGVCVLRVEARSDRTRDVLEAALEVAGMPYEFQDESEM